MNARVAIALAFFAAVACKRHEEAAPSSTTTAPLSSSGAAVEPLGGVPSAVAAADSDASMESHALDAGLDDPRVARQQALREAQEYGMFGLLNAGAADAGAIGNVFGGDVALDGGSFGAGGLGNIGTLGRGRVGHPSTARLSLGTLTVNGRLPPEVIRRIVRQNFGRFRLCYQEGLRSNPSLQGRVTTKFVIGSDGSVSSAKDNGSDIPDQSVVQCVVRGFSNIAYPQPEGGIVVVTAPVMFSPS